MTARIGVVGLGAMGGAIAARLAAQGWAVLGFDRDAAAVERAAAEGISPAAIEQVTGVDLLITSLPHDEIVIEVVTALAPRLERVRLVEMSTILPETMRRVTELLDGRVGELIDAPVSGGPDEARAGALSLMVGAAAEPGPLVRSVLASLGVVNPVGGLGDGKALKLVNNLIAMGNIAVMAEGFELGAALGVEPRVIYDVVNRSGGRSNHFAKRIPWALEDDFRARFAVRLAEKDLGLAATSADALGMHLPVTDLARSRFRDAMDAGLAEEDAIALVKLYRSSGTACHPSAGPADVKGTKREK